MSDSIAAVIFSFRQGVNRLLPVRFQFDRYNHQVSVHANVSNGNINFLEQWLDDIVIAAVGNQRITQQLCHVLGQAFNAIPLPNNNDGEFSKYLVVMVIDGALSLGDNYLEASNEFNRCGITLFVVATATSNVATLIYYKIIANRTGGECMWLANAPAILKRVILSAFNQTTDGVGDLPFDHGLSD